MKNEQESRAASIPELKSPRKVVEEYVNEELVDPLITCRRSTVKLDPDELELAKWPPWISLDELGIVRDTIERSTVTYKAENPKKNHRV